MDDLIIHSWCFHDVECFDSTPSAAIIILDKDLESFSSLRYQQFPHAPSTSSHPQPRLPSPCIRAKILCPACSCHATASAAAPCRPCGYALCIAATPFAWQPRLAYIAPHTLSGSRPCCLVHTPRANRNYAHALPGLRL